MTRHVPGLEQTFSRHRWLRLLPGACGSHRLPLRSPAPLFLAAPRGTGAEAVRGEDCRGSVGLQPQSAVEALLVSARFRV
jgi:hypothetical protein